MGQTMAFLYFTSSTEKTIKDLLNPFMFRNFTTYSFDNHLHWHKAPIYTNLSPDKRPTHSYVLDYENQPPIYRLCVFITEWIVWTKL